VFDAKHLLGALIGTGFGGVNRRPGFGGGGLFGAPGGVQPGGGGLLEAIGGMTGGGRGSGLAALAGLAGLMGAGGRLGKGAGLAALGGLALHALQNYQQRQGLEPREAGLPEAPRETVSESDAIVLVRAMVAAANADGRIDEQEQRRIEQQLERAAVSDEEREFIARELLQPVSVDALAREARTPELAQQIYGASLLAMTADTDAEKSYLQYLADRLGLSREQAAEIHRQLGV
jgi:uncharacterized membrane protein YebE (DUF533 family)